MKEATRFLKSILNKNDVIVLGISGGPDSMCLFHVLNFLKKDLDLKIVCAHVNHNLRIESNEEEKFVEKEVVINNCIFEYMKIKSYKNNKFTEDEARRKRYRFLFNVANKYNAKYIMTAHHGDDLIETVLMRIERHSVLSGYAGFKRIQNVKIFKTSYLSKWTVLKPTAE